MHTTILPSFCMVMVIYLLIDDTRKSLYDCIIKFLFDNTRRGVQMEEMDKKEIKDVIEWCDEKGHSEHEILELIRRIVGANPREEEK